MDPRKLHLNSAIVLLVALFSLGLVPTGAFAAGEVDVPTNDETVTDQAITANQELMIFTGSVESVGESEARIDTFNLDAEALSGALADNVDTIAFEFDGPSGTSDTSIDVDGGNSPPYAISISETLAGPSGPFDYEIRVRTLNAPNNDESFSITMESVEWTEAPGTPNSSPDQTTPNLESNEITVKNLIESYNEVQEIPRVLAAEGERIPLVHMEYAGANGSSESERTVIFDKLEFRIRELLGEFIPGTDLQDNNIYGDLSEVALVRSNNEEFGEGDQTTISTLSREDLPHQVGQDSYVISGLAPSTEDLEHFLTETTEESHYFITIRTNQGWGEYPGEPEAHSQAFGFGDAWDAFMDTGAVVLDDSNTGDTVTSTEMGFPTVDMTGKALYNSLVGRFVGPLIGPFAGSSRTLSETVDKFFGDPVILQHDNKGLDYHPNQIFYFTLLGPAEGGDEALLTSVEVTFPDRTGPFDPCEDLRDLTNGRFSGLSVWKNTSDFDSVGQEDTQLDLSVDSSSVCENGSNKAVLKLQDGEPLPSPSDVVASPDENMTVSRGLGGTDDLVSTFYVSALMDKTATAPDSFVASIRPGGLKFSDGSSVDDADTRGSINSSNNMQALRDTLPIHADTGSQQANDVRVFPQQLTDDADTIGAPSGPVGLIGLDVVAPDTPAGSVTWDLAQIDVQFEMSGTNFTTESLKDFSNTKESGIAIYRDDDDASSNINGTFQPAVDDRLNLDLTKTRNSTPTTESGRTNPIARLYLSDNAPIPKDNDGDSEGADYFVVINTSDEADNGDKFQASLGNAVIGDGVTPEMEFQRRSGTDTTSVFISGNGSATDRFFGEEITISTITFRGINPPTVPSLKINASGEPLKIFGIDATDSEPGDQTLDRIRTTFNFSDSTDPSDLRTLTENENSGVVLYKDKGEPGVFESERDDFVPLRNPNWTVYDDTATVDLIPDTALQVPDTDEDSTEPDDFYIALRASESIELGDTFSVSIRGGDIQFSNEASPEDEGATTPVIEASLPILLNDRTGSPRHKLGARGNRIDVLGINAADQGETETLEEVRVDLENVKNFSCDKDLADLSNTSESGVSIWRNTTGTNGFDPDQDNLLEPDTAPNCTSGELTFDFTSSSVDIPDSLNNLAEFFVVARTSSDIQHGTSFRISIPTGGISTTRFESGKGISSNPLVFGSSNIESVTFSDTDLMNDMVDATVEADNQDTVALALAINDEVSKPADQYEQVASKAPDQPDGSVFTFNDVNVSVTAETVGLVAKGYNDTGATGFSDKEIFTRKEIAGIDLEGRDDAELADALAADEGFGIVVFGQQGGSNTNPSDPAFDPSSDETLKIIPPRGESATMKVFNLDQQMVFETSTSMPGEAIEWGGEGLGVDVVNNGVYIVKVNSASEEKSFPVMVVK